MSDSSARSRSDAVATTRRVERLECFAAGNRNYIAAQGATACTKAITRLEKINALPRPPSTGSLMAESFVHGLYGNGYAGYALGADASSKQKALLDELTGLAAAAEKADAAHLLLPRVAERYAAPVGADGGRVAIDFDESWNAWGPHDWCRLYDSGDDLEDCTVVVELTGAGGRVRKNGHFVRAWAGKSWLHARSDAGAQVENRRVGRMTVADVAAVGVRLLSPRYSTEVRDTDTGAEKAKDVARRMEEVKPHLQFRVRDSAWGARSGKVLVPENRWKYAVVQVGVRVVSADGKPVGQFVRPRLDAGGGMDVGSLQVSRNLVAGDRVTVWLGEAELLATTVR